MRTYLKKLSGALFNELTSNEELALNLHSENSDFIRFNQSKVRQNTTVDQHELTLSYQVPNRSYKSTLMLTCDFNIDFQNCIQIIQDLRKTLPLIDENPKYSKFVNNGQSEVYKKSERHETPEIVKKISAEFATSDLAGFYCAGPIRQASVNSAGQYHYYENDQFFFDYSIYDGPRAAKGYYSENSWNDTEFTKQALNIKNTLSLLKKPPVEVRPGQHRTYLAPMAVAEIAAIFNWRALSRSAYEQGFTPLKKLYTKEVLFSKKFTLIENNDLGLNSHFNNQGELSPKYLPIIESGELKNFLINSATAKEYNLISNNADAGMWNNESMRSMDILGGQLAESEILKQLDTGLYLTNLHYINWSDPQAARITGMTRFACFWVEKGEIAGPIQDLRFDDNLYNLFGSELIDLTREQSSFISTMTYQKRGLGGMRVPGLLLNKMNFTL